MQDFKLPDEIRCLLSIDPETGSWVSRCLDFDLVTSGKTEEEAWTNIKSVVKLHIEHCFTHDHQGLDAHRAPEEDFELFRALEKTDNFWSDKIRLNLVAAAPQVPDDLSFWIRGIENALQATAPDVSAIH